MTDPDDILQVSLSAVKSFQTCQQQYFYRYIEGLKRRDRATPLELGVILHDYLSEYYAEIKRQSRVNLDPHGAHLVALLAVSTKHVPSIRRYANLAVSAGQEEVAKELLELPAKAARIAERYFEARGKVDADRFEILANEYELNLRMSAHIRSVGRLDLLTRDRLDGRVMLWDHKSWSQEPSQGMRIQDLQTMLYRNKMTQLPEFAGVEVDGVVWNYIRTKEPSVPDVIFKGTKRESITRRADIDTTWDVYRAAIEKAGMNPDDYADMMPRLEGRELSVFFPRYEQVILADEDIMMRDYYQTAKDIRRKRRLWAAGKAAPVRTLSMSCRFCEFTNLCEAVLISGDDEDVRMLRFTTKEQRDAIAN